MAERDYSQRTTAQKLGIEQATSVFILRPPDNYLTELGVEVPHSHAPYDFIQVFATSPAQLEMEFPHLRYQLTPNGMLWVCWPKKASGLATELTETTVREIGLAGGLVDVKVAAINDTWSGLKFVFRKTDR